MSRQRLSGSLPCSPRWPVPLTAEPARVRASPAAALPCFMSPLLSHVLDAFGPGIGLAAPPHARHVERVEPLATSLERVTGLHQLPLAPSPVTGHSLALP